MIRGAQNKEGVNLTLSWRALDAHEILVYQYVPESVLHEREWNEWNNGDIIHDMPNHAIWIILKS